MRTRTSAGLLGAVVIAAGLPLVAAGPANAACINSWKTYAVSISNSTEFDANAGCDGLWAWQADVRTDDVRGRFYKEGEWQTSTYGWKTVTTASQSGGKVVGDTVTDRRLKGQSMTYSQSIKSQY